MLYTIVKISTPIPVSEKEANNIPQHKLFTHYQWERLRNGEIKKLSYSPYKPHPGRKHQQHYVGIVVLTKDDAP